MKTITRQPVTSHFSLIQVTDKERSILYFLEDSADVSVDNWPEGLRDASTLRQLVLKQYLRHERNSPHYYLTVAGYELVNQLKIECPELQTA